MGTEPPRPRWPGYSLVAVVVLGLALRAYHYLRAPAVWHDEAALLMNVLTRDFGELLGPLLWHEAAPPLFLWLERATFLVCGDNLFALRLVPFLASCGALLLTVPVARALLSPAAARAAVLLLACAETMLWHSCEAKPYALDAFAATLLAAVYCCSPPEWLGRKLLVFTLLAPVLIFLSYPACFLYGGVLVAVLPRVHRQRQASVWAGYGLLAVTVGVSFLLLALGPARAQRDEAMASCWVNLFPDWERPWRVPAWAVLSSVEVVRYCFRPLGQPLAILAIVGAVRLWRRGRRDVVVLLALPVGLALVAALLHRYPYGGARVMVYAVPALALLIAAGTAPAVAWLRGHCRPAVGVVALLLLLPCGHGLRTVVVPWPRAETDAAAQWVYGRRGPDEVVLGNDWCHHYYFRRLGQQFRGIPPATNPPGDRVWLVYTAQLPAEERERETRLWFGDNWRVLQRREFRYTTVLMLARRRR